MIDRRSRSVRAVYLLFGVIFLAFGFLGLVLPIMPTTVFVILAAACFSRSSARAEAWLLNHPKFGPSLRQWRNHGAIAPKAKVFAIATMAVSFGVTAAFAPLSLFWIGVVAIVMTSVAAFIATRPAPPA
ncbi:MAG: YbaN family protein [Pseudomonadota bacterium]